MENKRNNILVLDDEKFILVTVKACLKSENYNVVTSESAQDAFGKFKQDEFDIIITDIMMEAIDGFKFRELIRAHSPKIPIIFLTSLLDDIDNTLLNKITSDQYSYYLNKAFTKKALLDVISKALETYHAADEIHVLQRRIESDLELAGQIQRMMLPHWCMINDDYAASYLYEPQFNVSGDLFEWIDLGSQRYLCVIGDVSGHGIPAALCMTPIQLLLKRVVFEEKNGEIRPHELLTRLNDFICRDLGMQRYMTCIAAIFDFGNNHLIYHTAGHPELICLQNGKIIRLNPQSKGSLPVGMDKSSKFLESDNVEFDFTDDTVFIAYTDGLMDIGSQGSKEEFVGEETLLDLISSLDRNENPVTIPFHVRSAIEQIGFDCPSDDIFLFAVKKNASRKNGRFITYVPASMTDIENGVIAASDYLDAIPNLQNAAGRTEILLSEFLTNVVKHGIDRDHSRFGIVIQLTVDADAIHVTILDRGKFWDYQKNYSDKDMDSVLNELNEQRAQNGRGMPLILSIASTITRKHYCGLNVTYFTVQREDNNTGGL